MSETLESTWATRELPSLRAALRRLDPGEMRRLRAEMHQRMLGNGYCARPVGLDCHFESICESCTFFQTTIGFRPTLERQDFPDLERIREEVGLDVAQMRSGLRALESAWPPCLQVQYTLGGPDRVSGHIVAVGERARRELGTWPSAETLVDRLAEALAVAADAEQEPQRKARLRAAADTMRSFARDVAVQAVGTQLGGVGPLG